MQKRLPKLMGATMLMLLMLSFLVATPARAANPAPPYGVPAQPIWAVVNALPQGNYPGGNEIFDIFVVNSEQPPNGNVTLVNETLTAPALPPESQTNSAIGIPIMLSPGQAILNTIALPIPSDFTQSNFTANLVAYVFYWNGTTNIPLKLTATAQVFMLSLPGSTSQTTTSSSASQTTQTTQTATQSGTVSTTLFAAGVALPSIVVVILLILLVRGRGPPK